MNLFKNKEKNFIFSLLALAITYLIFRFPIENILNKYVVQVFLNNIQSSIFNDWLFYSGIGICCWLTIERVSNKYVISKRRILVFSLLTLLSIRYRHIVSIWRPVYFTNELLAYADIFYFIIGAELVPPVFRSLYQFISNSNNKNEINQLTPFYTSKLTKNYEDKYGRAEYAKLIAKRINQTTTDLSFGIGITGQWGAGKSFFSELILKELKKLDRHSSKYIFIRFNPWNTSDSGNIYKEFFLELKKAISPYSLELNDTLKKYFIRVSDASNNSYLSDISGTLTNNEPIDLLKSRINEILRQTEMKIIVHIDDMDRLNSDEATEVLRIVRNSADFYNTFFIVSYDRDYLSEAIKSKNPHNSSKFLEKIFQYEVSLPIFERNSLRNNLFSQLDGLLSNNELKQIETSLQPSASEAVMAREGFGSKTYLNIFTHTIRNPRDLERLLNTFTTDYQALKDEIVVSDLFKLSLLKIKYPQVYQLISDNIDLIFKRTTVIQSKNISVYTLLQEENAFELKKLANEHKIELSDNAINFIKKIFPDSTASENHTYPDNKYLSIIYTSQTYKYFSYHLYDDDISQKNMTTVLSGLEEGRNFINSISNNKPRIEKLIYYLIKEDLSSQSKFLISLKLILYCDRKVRDNLWSEISVRTRQYIIEIFQTSYYETFKKDIDKLFDSFIEILTYNPPPYIQEASIIDSIISRYYHYEEFKDVVLRLSDYVIENILEPHLNDKAPDELAFHYLFASSFPKVSSKQRSYNPRAIQAIKDSMVVNFDNYCATLFINPEPYERTTYQLNGWFDIFFESREDGVSFFKSVTKNKEIGVELAEFISITPKENTFIEFNFSKIKPDK